MKNVVLIGFMGTGKSSCGRAIAQQLGYRLVDLDKKIETKYKMPIPTMFKVHGEDWFRQKEKEMVAYWARQKNVVISTGGGTVKNPAVLVVTDWKNDAISFWKKPIPSVPPMSTWSAVCRPSAASTALSPT